MDKITTLLIAVLLAIPVTLWRGYVLMVLWGWFIVPTFNAPVLSVAVAIGVTIIGGLFTVARNESKNEEKEHDALTHFFVAGLVQPAMALGIGYIVTHWM